MNKPEVLSPAGDRESFLTALRYGADAVYLAGKNFGMRTASKNFSAEELKLACEKAHQLKKKVYLTCNTLPRNADLPQMPDFLRQAEAYGVDAFIIADLGVFEMAKRYAPSVERHISTQGGIINYESALAWYQLGAKRVVLAREMRLEEIAELRSRIPDALEIECFVHGAMCVSFSGRCLISSFMTGRDANRGDCAQPCRWKYHLVEENRPGEFFPVEENEKGTYLYNSRDLCMIEHIPALVKAGVNSLKIEGRAKTYYYTAVTTNAYRHAVDEYFDHRDDPTYRLSPWIREELEKISHRAYSTGFFFGEPGQETESGGYIRHYNAVAVCEESLSDTVAVITQRNKFLVGDTLDILPPDGFSYEVKCLRLTNEEGEEVPSAPHPMQKLWITADRRIPKGSVIRKRNDI
ncbi:peptidase U32 family protein [Ruminococcus sp.]|uniref:peptidase U32 family protein n=1 Tax=Ruminococcus sp. TaxID=41978 RepID=UPI0038900C94